MTSLNASVDHSEIQILTNELHPGRIYLKFRTKDNHVVTLSLLLDDAEQFNINLGNVIEQVRKELHD